MNIFKILANGDGSINEPNVSAFLAYLLDPYADHGLEDAFLRAILQEVVEEYGEKHDYPFADTSESNERYLVKDISQYSNFEFVVLLEQAFLHKNESKNIVDIILLCFEKNISQKENKVTTFIENNSRGILRHIFLIENKIRDSSSREGQLAKQCIAAKHYIENNLNNIEKDFDKKEIDKYITTIFIAPDEDNANKEFKNFQENSDAVGIKKIHIPYLSSESAGKKSIVEILQSILKREASGELDAIHEYSKSTLKSFIAFVQTGFRSALTEKKEGRKQIEFDIYTEYDLFKSKKTDFLEPQWWETLDFFQKATSDYQKRFSKTHLISVSTPNSRGKLKKIFSITKKGNKIVLQIITRHHSIPDFPNSVIKYLEGYVSDKTNIKYDEKQNYGMEIDSSEFKDAESILSFFYDWENFLKKYEWK